MKFVILAIAVVALVAVVQSSVIPIIGGAGSGSIAIQASAANGPQAAINIQTIPNIVAVPTAADPIVTGQATYVAKNRGVVHVAPLEGHVQSAVSLNLQAPPGTA